ncbi:MAG: Holliday junction resolvase RuvX, partial [Candidatus Paceibacterota bacterium]
STEHNIALPLKVIQNNNTIWDELDRVIKEYGINYILVGLPLNFQSNDTQQTLKVRNFIQDLESKFAIKIEEYDERLTSSLAKRYIPKGQSIDIESARILLEEWLDKQ